MLIAKAIMMPTWRAGTSSIDTIFSALKVLSSRIHCRKSCGTEIRLSTVVTYTSPQPESCILTWIVCTKFLSITSKQVQNLYESNPVHKNTSKCLTLFKPSGINKKELLKKTSILPFFIQIHRIWHLFNLKGGYGGSDAESVGF